VATRDDARYVEFVAAVQERLRRTAYLMCGDWATAADVTQEALLRVYVAWPRLERGAGLPTYARRALVSALTDHQRQNGNRRKREDRVRVPATVEDGSSDRADRAVLVQALRAVPQRQRACIVLRYFEDLSVADTSAALGCSEGTVKSQTSSGIAALRRELERLGLPDLAAATTGGI
jgi:RNA polymerase sigma-70 factor (sigma-E family)